MGEAGDFSRRVIGNIDYAIGHDPRSAAEIVRQAGMSKNYFYVRMRGEKPFNTNDVDALAEVLGLDPFDLLSPRSSNVTELRPRGTVGSVPEDLAEVAYETSHDYSDDTDDKYIP